MIDLDLYVDALTFGRVLGVGVGDDRVRIEQALGADCVEEANGKKWMRRDYGLIEFNFNQVDREWICFGFSIQLHRLAAFDVGAIVPRVILDNFGDFRRSVELDALTRRMQARGDMRKLVCEKMTADFGYFGVEDVKAKVIVDREMNNSTVDPVFGDVWSIEIL